MFDIVSVRILLRKKSRSHSIVEMSWNVQVDDCEVSVCARVHLSPRPTLFLGARVRVRVQTPLPFIIARTQYIMESEKLILLRVRNGVFVARTRVCVHLKSKLKHIVVNLFVSVFRCRFALTVPHIVDPCPKPVCDCAAASGSAMWSRAELNVGLGTVEGITGASSSGKRFICFV